MSWHPIYGTRQNRDITKKRFWPLIQDREFTFYERLYCLFNDKRPRRVYLAIIKLRLEDLIPRSVCLSVCPKKITNKITKLYKALPPHPHPFKDCQGSFGSMPEIP